ncbi:arginine deiminase-related protein [Bacteriovoracaceae bacterium]|nr:arginine deiminase-related protein [Bacteriovoracaceae bacterium]
MNYPKQILMVKPNNFRIDYVINKHMNKEAKVDINKALFQWGEVKNTYESLGFKVIEMLDQPEYPDMVFCANTLFTYPDGMLLSQMKHEERRGEVDIISSQLNRKNKTKITKNFEAMGDLLWCYQTEELFGGYGFRTSEETYDQIEEILNYKIIRLHLINDNYYHLDTCLSIINEKTALIVESAFDKIGLEILRSKFSQLIYVDENEALKYLACNAHCPDGMNVLVESRAIKLRAKLDRLGFKTIGLETGDFLKSGGSIFCMKNQGWFYDSDDN